MKNELALFAGAGGGILGGALLGWRTVCAVEWNAYAASVLAARQNDGSIEAFPIWDDVQTFDGKPWRGAVDVISGGFPCQDISAAGKGAGIEGAKSSMWKHMARIVSEVRPKEVFIENSPLLRTRGLEVVLEDLAGLGYDARWGVVSAENAGSPHRRKRMWVIAADTNSPQRTRDGRAIGVEAKELRAGHDGARGAADAPTWQAQPRICGVDDGMANRLDRLRAIGNGQAAPVVPIVWELLG